MKKKILYTVTTIIIAIVSFVYGRYEIIWGRQIYPDGSEAAFDTPTFTSYYDMSVEARQRSIILMDIIEDIRVDKPDYFVDTISVFGTYKELQSHFYEWCGDGPWYWDDMYNH